MFSFSQRLSIAAFIYVFISVGIASSEDVTSLADSKDLLNTMPIELTKVFDFKIPPRPDGYVLDMAHFLTPEMKQSLDDILAQEARDHGVSVYLLTMPTLQKDTLDPYTQKVTEAWMKGLFGATLVFDDGTGRVAIQQSEEVTKRFYEFELSQLLRETNSAAKRPRLSRAGLDYTVRNVQAALHELKMRANRADRKAHLTQLGLAAVGLLAILLVVGQYFWRRGR